MDITVDELKSRMEKGEKINLIDVRELHEFEEQNLGGQLIPLGSLPERLTELEHLKDAEIIIHCRSGNRSGQAKKFLESKGYTNVRNLLGGVLEYFK